MSPSVLLLSPVPHAYNLLNNFSADGDICCCSFHILALAGAVGRTNLQGLSAAASILTMSNVMKQTKQNTTKNLRQKVLMALAAILGACSSSNILTYTGFCHEIWGWQGGHRNINFTHHPTLRMMIFMSGKKTENPAKSNRSWDGNYAENPEEQLEEAKIILIPTFPSYSLQNEPSLVRGHPPQDWRSFQSPTHLTESRLWVTPGQPLAVPGYNTFCWVSVSLGKWQFLWFSILYFHVPIEAIFVPWAPDYLTWALGCCLNISDPFSAAYHLYQRPTRMRMNLSPWSSLCRGF